MKAVVHIGWPKTGSSAIQDFLHLNTEALADRGVQFRRNVARRGSQFEYPAATLGAAGTAHLSRQSRQRFRLRDAQDIARHHGPHLDALADFPARHPGDLAVFSSEHISAWVRTAEAARAFDARFSAVFDEVRYVAYIRDPVDFIPSEVSERAKRGAPVAMNQFVDHFIKTIDWSEVLLGWADAVGRDRLDLRLLDRGQLVGGDLLVDFCHVLGVPFDGLQQPKVDNASLTLPGLLAMRRIAEHIPAVDEQNGGVNPRFKATVARVIAATANGQKLRLNAAQRERVVAGTAEWQERLRAAFFPDAPSLFAPKGDAGGMNFKAADRRAQAVVAEILADQAPADP